MDVGFEYGKNNYDLPIHLSASLTSAAILVR
jgi:hypothetical protein